MNEFDLINIFTKDEPQSGVDLIKGYGDDCAVIKNNDKWWLITTDALLEDVHFKNEFISPYELGFKSLAVNLSDIASMGGLPRFYLLTIGLPKDKLSIANEIQKGLKKAADEFGVQIIGGDTIKSDKIMISITLIGETKPEQCAFRNTAKPNDLIFITGEIGSSKLGLEYLFNAKNKDKKGFEPFIEKHIKPVPRLRIAQTIVQNNLINSMIDVSDGLVADLNHIANQSQVGYEIHFDNIPKHSDFKKSAELLELQEHELVLSGGEDYELIFTAPSKNENKILELSSDTCNISKIGFVRENKTDRKILDSNGNNIELKIKGFNHFGIDN